MVLDHALHRLRARGPLLGIVPAQAVEVEVIPSLKGYALAGAAVAVLVALSAVIVQQGRLDHERADHMRTKAAHAQQLQRIAESTTKAATAAQRAQHAHQQVVAAIDTQRTQELSNALADNDSLRAAGAVRLRIAASCPRPAAAPGVPGAATSASVDTQAADLAPEAGQAVWDLRAALIAERAQLLALQDYARQCSAQGQAP